VSRIVTGNITVDNATINELKDFIASWDGKLTIPPSWIQDNLRDARSTLRSIGEEE